MRRWAVPAVPFALSFCLSIATVGPHPYWQDSGLYLTAVKELGVLYPPGFVVYELLCKGWTLLLFFVDFTLAVHLFSSLCAAAAAGVMAVAVRDFLRSRGPVFRTLPEDPGPLADEAGILAGLLLAGGYTFWSAAIYAKGYAFYYLILALLLWRMIRADDQGRPRDFTVVAALIGLAWQAHPSSVLTGGALLLFVAMHARTLGGKGIAGRILVAAAFGLGPSLLVLPWIVAREPWLMFNRPSTLAEFWRFISGGRYTRVHGAFGYDPSRGAAFLRFAWEDLLGIGLVLLGAGLVSMARRNRRLLTGLLAWFVPYAAITILFKTEVQHDCWLVGARMPFFLAIGLGAVEVGRLLGTRGILALRTAAAAATIWAAVANYGDLNQRSYLPAELYARTILDQADPNAVVLLAGDESNGLVSYLQRVRGRRPDVILVTSSFLNSQASTGAPWYDEALLRRNPSLKAPDYAALRTRFPEADAKQLATAAFINANADGARPLLSEVAVLPELLRPDLTVVAAGVFLKIVPPGTPAALDERYWRFPIEPEELRPQYRRIRGQDVSYEADGVHVTPICYERRLAALILRARFRLALARFEGRQFVEAARLCQSIVDFGDDQFENSPEIIHLLAISYYGAGQGDRAEPALRRSVELSVRPENRATALYYLGELARKRGDSESAQRYVDQALAVPGVPPAYLRAMQAQGGRR
ncbi:MAG TPA: DUF2723 domain-containing protein [Planctomycetota bacterium]|nr:DUF2723 domain-containing protein [Planctomycetota bacterium]